MQFLFRLFYNLVCNHRVYCALLEQLLQSFARVLERAAASPDSVVLGLAYVKSIHSRWRVHNLEITLLSFSHFKVG